MLLAAFLFATMGVCVKFASAYVHSFEIVMVRGAIGVLALAWWYRREGLAFYKTTRPGMHLWRNVVGVTSLCCWFYAIGEIPLATAMTLQYMSSVWMAVFMFAAALMMQSQRDGMRQQGPLFASILLGFIGVALLLRPTFSEDQGFAAIIGLLSGIISALAYLQVAAMARAGEPDARVVLYFSVGAAVTGLGGTFFVGFSPLSWAAVGWLLPVGLLAVLGQICLTRAYASGATLLVANLQYSGIVFASFYSIILFSEVLPLFSWVGMGLIICGGIWATLLRRSAPAVADKTPPSTLSSNHPSRG
jgi:S-adenosylmethionine uptake transporter